MMRESALCDQGGRRHTWKSTGLDVIDGVLMVTRRCLRCPTEQGKPYGAGGRKSWKTVCIPEKVDDDG